jgi:hypothetical protein
MRRKISALMISTVILSVLLIPTVLASKPRPLIPVSGTWSWGVSDWSERYANGNTFVSATEIDEFKDGTFIGIGEGPFTMTIHRGGFITGSGRTTFTGTVDGHSGTCVIMWVGKTINDQFWWSFKWIIISGTGGLSNLRGQGTCYGPGPSGVEMTGKIHFDPS